MPLIEQWCVAVPVHLPLPTWLSHTPTSGDSRTKDKMGAETETTDMLHFHYKSLLLCRYVVNALYVYVVRVLKYIQIYIQWVLDYPNPDYLYPDIWTSAHVAMFSVPTGKIRCSH